MPVKKCEIILEALKAYNKCFCFSKILSVQTKPGCLYYNSVLPTSVWAWTWNVERCLELESFSCTVQAYVDKDYGYLFFFNEFVGCLSPFFERVIVQLYVIFFLGGQISFQCGISFLRAGIISLLFPEWLASSVLTQLNRSLWSKWPGNVSLIYSKGFHVCFPNIKLAPWCCALHFLITLFILKTSFLLCPNDLNMFSFNTVVLGWSILIL